MSIEVSCPLLNAPSNIIRHAVIADSIEDHYISVEPVCCKELLRPPQIDVRRRKVLRVDET